MINDTDTRIELALTPEQWVDDLELMIWNLAGDRHHPARLHERIAVANAALPDGDRRKITREDVRALSQASVVFRLTEWEVGTDEEATARLRALAAKLAALLPPEEK